jgi:hypothetical protein
MLWVCIFSLIFRSRNTKRRVQVTLFIETAILGLWIPPVYYLAKEIWLIDHFRDYPIPKSSIAALTMWALNMYVWEASSLLTWGCTLTVPGSFDC